MKKIILFGLMLPAFATMSAAEELPFIAEPVPGSTVENLSVITLTSSDGVYDLSSISSGNPKAYFKVNGEFFCNGTGAESGLDWNLWEIASELLIYTPCECELVIEPGFLKWYDEEDDQQTNSETITLKYTIEGGYSNPTDLPLSVTPADDQTFEKLESVTITANGDYNIEFDSRYASLIYFAQNGKKFCDANCTLSTDRSSLEVKPATQFTETGKYDLIILPYGITYVNKDDFWDYGYNDTPLVYSYDVNIKTGISDIATDKENGDIYNLFGVKMNGSFDSLAPGIYIVNGKKIAK